MAIRYTTAELLHLRDSPLVVKPPGLDATQWMGPPPDARASSTRTIDRTKNHDSNSVLDQSPRRPQHISRNSANPEDIILGPPKTSFMSATSSRMANKSLDSPDRSSLRDLDSRDRFTPRTKLGEGDSDRLRGGRDTLRPKRAEGDADNEGWSTVKPRKSFGTEGAERFNGRMGLDRHRDDTRRFKDREERDVKDRPPRGFDTFSRDRDVEHEPDSRRNGLGRARNESWLRGDNDGPPTPRDRNSNGDKMADRSRGWREKERDDRPDRDQKQRWERGGRDRRDQFREDLDPEWLDEPVEEKTQEAHTQEDFQKWKESMRKTSGGKQEEPPPPKLDPNAGASFFGLEKPKVETPLAVETGPDKFFGMWATPKEEIKPDLGLEAKPDTMAKAKTIGKASRFTSFFAPQEEAPRRQTEPPMPPPSAPGNDISGGPMQGSSQSNEEKAAFQSMLQKLQSSSMFNSMSPPANPHQQPQPPPPPKSATIEKQQTPVYPPPMDNFQQFRHERPEERPSTSARNSQHALQELLNQRSMAGSQTSIRPDLMLQELVGQRQNALSQSSIRPEPSQNPNTQFLMNLMKNQGEPQRTEQMLLRMPPQKSNDRSMQQQIMEREQELHREAAARERSASQRQTRPQAPPGFFDEAAFQRGPAPQTERHSANPQQPMQILQRPPPGLDQNWAPSPTSVQQQQQIRQQQHIAPPPGLSNGPSRGMPMPQQMYPPGFPNMGNNFPPPDVMGGPPRMQPPPGFFNAPPPGFLPPGMGGFQGSEGFGGPFDGRGPPPGGFRRQ